MAVDSNKPSPERAHTNESLRTEREKTDRALSDRHAAEANADSVVETARQNADAVLAAARDKADERAAPRPSISGERAVADDLLRDERATADEILQRERDTEAQALSKLLPIERDKTDRFLLTERARADYAVSNRDDFLGIVSHDLRNLLSGIVMSATLLSDSAPATDAGKDTRLGAQRIHRYAARMNRLIGDLVDVASIDAGKLAVTPAQGDSSLLVVEAAETFQGAAAAKQISLETELLERPLEGKFDHDRMLQVFANLITNSIKFTSEGGKIWVRGVRAKNELHFSIRDTGSGIPGNMLEAVFERFWQLGKNDRRGLGLGLYISKCIVEAHGGRIWAESTHGEGSTFWFTLPGAV